MHPNKHRSRALSICVCSSLAIIKGAAPCLFVVGSDSVTQRLQDGSTRVLPEVRDERQGMFRAVTQPGLEVQHATTAAGFEVRLRTFALRFASRQTITRPNRLMPLTPSRAPTSAPLRCIQVATVVSSATDAVVSAAEAVGSAVSTAVVVPVERSLEHLKKTVPAVKNLSDGINGLGENISEFMERTGETFRPVTDGALRCVALRLRAHIILLTLATFVSMFATSVAVASPHL